MNGIPYRYDVNTDGIMQKQDAPLKIKTSEMPRSSETLEA